MTSLQPSVRASLGLKLFGAVVLAIGLSRLVSGFRARDVLDLVSGVMLLAIAVAAGVRLLRSDEARKAPRDGRARRAEQSLLSAYGEPAEALPIAALQRSRGAQLDVRLGPRGNSGLAVIVISASALVANGLVWPATCAAWQKAASGLGFFVVAGIGSGLLALFAIATTSSWIGARKAPVVEISREPIAPGESFELCVVQPGPAKFVKYGVRLVCVERAWSALGRNQTHEHVASNTLVLEEHALMVGAGQPWTITRTVTVPEQAMHSFTAPYNEIVWELVVQASIDGWPDFEQTYPLRVLPKPPGSAT